MKLKNCKHCSNTFQPTGVKQKYCSALCQFKSIGYTENNGCHIWNGTKNSSGYGVFKYNKKYIKAHKFSCEIVDGQTSKELHVLHSCDNPSCINQDHLRYGTNKDNMNDKKIRNRQVKGSKHKGSKLTEDQVENIRDKLTNYKRGMYHSLASIYKVTLQTIKNIHDYKNWKHIK